ncbi:hypothetical protein U8593_00865 [Aquirufa antheringensis]
MSKKQQLEILKQSIQNGIETEVQLFIESIDLGEVYEYHLQDKFENGTFDKLNDSDYDNVLSKLDYQIEVKLNFNFN